MGLILCDNIKVTHPLYIVDMGIRVFSLEQLCYVIYNYPLIAMDSLVNERLFDFLENDLRVRLQMVNRDRRFMSGKNNDDILINILDRSDYYSVSEIEQYKLLVADFRKLPRYEFLRRKADLLLDLKQYGKAISCFEYCLNDAKDQHPEDSFFFRVYKSMGQTYANLYRLKDAFQSFKNALSYGTDEDIYKMIYYLSKIDNDISYKKVYLHVLNSIDTSEWDIEFERISQEVKESESISELEQLSELDSVKLHSNLERILSDWKRKYRNML